MSKLKATPGPWKISEYRNGHSMIIEGSDEWDVAEVGYPNRDPNAHLIAAAPELYRLLDEALSYTSCESWSPSLTDEIKTALAKARGEG